MKRESETRYLFFHETMYKTIASDTERSMGMKWQKAHLRSGGLPLSVAHLEQQSTKQHTSHHSSHQRHTHAHATITHATITVTSIVRTHWPIVRPVGTIRSIRGLVGRVAQSCTIPVSTWRRRLSIDISPLLVPPNQLGLTCLSGSV